MEKKYKELSTAIKIAATVIGFSAMIMFFYAMFGPVSPGEADIGIKTTRIATIDDWTLIAEDGSEKDITLPYREDSALNKTLRIKSTLPDDIPDGRAICIRSSIEDVTILINGRERAGYKSDDLMFYTEHAPSAYVFARLTPEDSGAEVEIDITAKSSTYSGLINTVYYSSPRAIWLDVMQEGSVSAIFAIALALLGVITIFVCLAFKRGRLDLKKPIYLGQSMVLIGMWIVSESRIRQIIFKNPSFTSYFAFILAGIMAFPVVLFFNEVQKKRYRKYYMLICLMMVLQAIVNAVLDFLKIRDFYSTKSFGHLWIILAVVTFIVTLIIDLVKGYIKEYPLIAVGIAVFMACAVVEIANVYAGNPLGPVLSFGMVMLLLMTLAQTIRDAYTALEGQRKHQIELTLATIRMVAAAVDAKDEYTGGHSNRVAMYALILAKALGYSDDDVERVRYIALMHDVGKIGVPDVILNKNGKLSDDEFMLMKLHTTIGSDMLRDIENVPGLCEGVKHHHERYDGHGYPDKLKGEEIPEIARILCLADSYDAMTSNRVYRRRLTDAQVRDEIERCSGSQFDPMMVPVFLSLLDSGEIKPISEDGFEYSAEGNRSKAAILQKMLVSPQEYSGAYEVTNPEFMRMLVYIVKLAERNRQNIKIMLFKVEESPFSVSESEGSEEGGIEGSRGVDMMLERAVTGSLRSTDITTPYAPMQRLVVFVDLDDENAMSVINRIIVSFKSLDKSDRYVLKYDEVDLNGRSF